MNVLIIEDEDVAADRLESLLKDVAPNISVRKKIGSVRESIKWLRDHTVDLIFIDIRLSDGLSFSIFEETEVHAPLIFTTAYDQYAIKAFQHNSIAYLLKPVRKEELKDSLEKLHRLRSAIGIDFRSVQSAFFNKKPEFKKRFLITVGEKLKTIESEQIAYFYALEKNVFCKTEADETYDIDFSLDALEEVLNPESFFRINRKYIVNMNAIDKMVAWSRNRIKLDMKPPVKGKEDAVVSISRSADFKKWLGS